MNHPFFNNILSERKKHPLTVINIPNLNLEGIHLEGANLKNAILINVNLEGANLNKADLRGADLRGANLKDSELFDAKLEGINLEGADLSDANLKANLTNANLKNAILKDANLIGANLEGTDLEGADLEGAKITEIIGIPYNIPKNINIQYVNNTKRPRELSMSESIKTQIQKKTKISHKDREKLEIEKRKKTKKLKNIRKNIQSRRIQRFFRQTETRRVSHYLSVVCSDSGQCIGFGLEVEKIKKFFNNFGFDYVVYNKIKRVGNISDNGFVNEIPYKRDNYISYAILKSSLKENSDNLYYEGFVGIFINKLNLLYPCFLETYSTYIYNDLELYNELKGSKAITSLDGLTPFAKMTKYKSYLNPKNVNMSCINSKNICILIQHLKNIKSIESLIWNYKHDEYFFTVKLVCYLYQVYSCLGELSDVFTHYDLHTDNVLIYNITNSNDKYIKMIYHYSNGEVIEFLTTDIVKIIDYGRSYFKDKSISSKSMWDIIYDIKQTPDCYGDGYDYGYLFLNEEHIEGNNSYISSQKRNMSHDLRLANNIEDIEKKYSGDNSGPLKSILSSVHKNYIFRYGTKEVSSSDFTHTGEIKNVIDMHLALKNLIKNEGYFVKKNVEYYVGKVQIGELHIWLDRSKPMEYISTISAKRSEYF